MRIPITLPQQFLDTNNLYIKCPDCDNIIDIDSIYQMADCEQEQPIKEFIYDLAFGNMAELICPFCYNPLYCRINFTWEIKTS